MIYAVFFEERAAKELARIDKPYQLLIKKKIEQLTENFDSMVNNLKPLKGKYDYYRLRVGSYRVIFHKDSRKIIISIVRIGHRKSIYKDFD
ncbi:MAG: type II toxin-antitoxin system RelE/ParE family toxin [Candidatus Aminicenantes bacterium]|nr:type II toxin-antitoxin system RelE/ParE family toxin [Candidatus Aminicenantes bacterium]